MFTQLVTQRNYRRSPRHVTDLGRPNLLTGKHLPTSPRTVCEDFSDDQPEPTTLVGLFHETDTMVTLFQRIYFDISRIHEKPQPVAVRKKMIKHLLASPGPKPDIITDFIIAQLKKTPKQEIEAAKKYLASEEGIERVASKLKRLIIHHDRLSKARRLFWGAVGPIQRFMRLGGGVCGLDGRKWWVLVVRESC